MMGDKFQVWNWEECLREACDYEWVLHYGGEDKAEAFAKLEELKANHAPCVKLEW